MIKYIGSKRKLIGAITDVVSKLQGVRTVMDLFSGTSRVGHALKNLGYSVLANDHNRYAYILAQCYIEADRDDVIGPAQKLINEFNTVPGKAGYFTETYCIKSRYFHSKNGERIDAIRDAIAAMSLSPELEAVLLVSLMEAADRVDSTTGLQMAYLKQWAPRAYHDLELRLPRVLPRATAGKGRAYCLDVSDATKSLSGDLAYLDPPYNQHNYLGNYHIWESLVRWDKPDVYGVACKRLDVKERRSTFNSKRTIRDSLNDVVNSVDARYLLVSFNNEGYITRDDMEDVLSQRGRVDVIEHDYKRYVGAQIGVYNPQGERVGKVSHLNNKEYLYLVRPA